MERSHLPASLQVPVSQPESSSGAAPDNGTLDLRHLTAQADRKDGSLLQATQAALDAAFTRAQAQSLHVVHILLPAHLDRLPDGLDRFAFLRELDIPSYQGRELDLRALPGESKAPLRVRLDQAAELTQVRRLDGGRQQVLGVALHQRKVVLTGHASGDGKPPAQPQSLPGYAYWRSPRSERPKDDDVQSLNLKARFAGTQDPIVCRHLSTAFWLARMDYLARKHTGDVKSAPNPALRFEDFFTSTQDIQDKVPASMQARWCSECTRSTENHLVATRRWNEFLQGRFTDMVQALAPGQAHACTPWLVMSSTHAMYLELQVKRDAEAQVHGVVLMYDPNVTGSYRRVRLDDPCAAACALEDLLPRLRPEEDPVANYFGEPADDRVAMVVALPELHRQPGAAEPAASPARPRGLDLRCAPPQGHVHEAIVRLFTGLSDGLDTRVADPAQRAALARARIEGPTDQGGRYHQSLVGIAIGYDDATLVRTLAAMATPTGARMPLAWLYEPSPQGTTPLAQALKEGKPLALRALMEAAEGSDASVEDLQAFYAAPHLRTPALYTLAVDGSDAMLEPYCEALSHSRLFSPQKLELLRAVSMDGTPAMHAAARAQRLGAVRTLAASGRAANLDSAAMLKLLDGRTFVGITCLQEAMDQGRAEVVRVLMDEALRSGLDAAHRIAFVTAPRMNGMSALLSATLGGHTEAVKAWTEGALSLLASADVSPQTRRQVLMGLKSTDDKSPTMFKLMGVVDNAEHLTVAWAQCIARAPESQLSHKEKRDLLGPPVNKLHLLKPLDGKRR